MLYVVILSIREFSASFSQQMAFALISSIVDPAKQVQLMSCHLVHYFDIL